MIHKHIPVTGFQVLGLPFEKRGNSRALLVIGKYTKANTIVKNVANANANEICTSLDKLNSYHIETSCL